MLRSSSFGFLFLCLAVGFALLASGCSCGVPAFNRCIPVTCDEADANCGNIDDGCGGTIGCGYCAAGYLCDDADNVCVIDPNAGRGDRSDGLTPCEPMGCAEAGYECSRVGDGCAGLEICGFCGGGGQCGAGHEPGTCGQSICQPTSCEKVGAECGMITDGCGGVIDCGGCEDGLTCGGAGANRCGTWSCNPRNDCEGACGLVSNDCDGLARCPGCPGDELCVGGTCVPGAEVIGEPCTLDQECLSGYCLTESEKGWHLGYCTAPCGSDSDCGEGNMCGFLNHHGAGVCLVGCQGDLDCRAEGYVCAVPEGAFDLACVPGGTGQRTVADHCDTFADCDGGPEGLCLRDVDGFPGGYCTLTCGFQGPCPPGTECVFDAQERGICVGTCNSSADCRPDYVCRDVGNGVKGCWPAGGIGDPCTDHEECASGVCMSEERHGWPGGYCTDRCESDADCPEGVCLPWGPNGEGICVRSCDSDSDCREGYACVETESGGTACLPFGGGDGQIGDPCNSAADCPGGEDAVCVPTPDGGRCSTRCSTDQDCPPGFECITDGPVQPGFCQIPDLIVNLCGDDDDCPEGMICIDTPTGRMCAHDCEGDHECPDGMICTSDPVFGGPGYCVPGGPGGGDHGGPGSPCEDDFDCESGICIPEELTGWPGGFCAAPCETDADCDTGEICVAGGPGGQKMCMPGCRTDRDCRPGYYCRDLGGTVPVCAPADGPAGPGDQCEDANACPDGMVCITQGHGRICVPTCTDNDECADDQVCRPLDDGMGTGYCDSGDENECRNNEDCPEGQVCGIHVPTGSLKCMDEDSGGVDWGIPEDEVFGPNKTGDPCEENRECERLQCFVEATSGWKEGYCTGHCSSDSDCAKGSICGLKRTFEIVVDASTGSITLRDVTSSFGFEPGYGVSFSTKKLSKSVIRALMRWLFGRFFGSFDGMIVMGHCLKECSDHSECRDGYRCHQVDEHGGKACIPFADGSGYVGDTCKIINDCPGGLQGFCKMESWGYPGGYCAMNCVREPCPEGSRCADVDDSKVCMHTAACTEMGRDCEWVEYETGDRWETPDWGYCCETGRICTPTLPCPLGSGEECSSHRSGWGFCSPCLGERPCRDDYACYSPDRGTGVCFPSAKGSRSVGRPCTQLRDCAGGVDGLCLREEAAEDGEPGWPGGYCSRGCRRSCPSGSSCAELITGDRICLEDCKRSGGFFGFGSSYSCERDGYQCISYRSGFLNWKRSRVCIAVPELLD